ncbi:TPA: hypothetical protein ACGO9Z_001443 [Streptococcus suis]|uniref:hypothetical protein n=1 Tax=Streptococcus suis TaxID=1307 RepID=UPI000CF4D4FB|nr:hypothetical protein [Streptococcus suis]NQL65800.1 hypothetical protein [Streptococcus suis]NQM14649.1 hypothetical protein [Streptococcus suis]
MRKERLLSATFEQSKKVVSKKILTEEGAQVGVLSSMKLSQRFSGLVILLLFIMSYGVGVYLPESLLTSTEKIRYISTSTAQSIVTIGTIFRIPLLALMYCSIVMVIINVFPKKNYAHQLLYGTITLLVFLITVFLMLFPFTIGLTVGAFGWIGFLLQLLVCVYLWKTLVISNVEQLKKQLYKGEPANKDWGESLMAFIKKYGGVLLLLAIVNRWTFNFGEAIKTRPDIFSFLYGWAFLLVAALMIFTTGMTLKNFVAAFYFFKYQKEYRQFFKISNEQWYGKWRGKMIDKKKQKEK